MHKSTNPHNTQQQLYHKLLEEEQENEAQNNNESPEGTTTYQHHEITQAVEMVIEYGQNATASILVNKQDDPLTLAQKFCYKHNIDPHVINTLANNIRSLQNATFATAFRREKNSPFHQDKENHNTSNYLQRSRSKSQQKSTQNSKMKQSRTKTNQSFQYETTLNPHRTSNSGYSVFQRLYQDSRKKQTSRTQQANLSKRSESRVSVVSQNKSVNESSVQSCLHIYEKNTKLKEESTLHSQHLLQAKKLKEVESCSFQPQINPLSNLIATKLRELDESSILNRTANEKQMLKIKQYLLKKEQEQMNQCTFKPKIIAKLTQNNTERFLAQREYPQPKSSHKPCSKKMQSKQSKYQPQINQISKIIVKKGFFQRLEQDQQKRIQKQQRNEKSREKSKQRRPSTGRPPANRNLDNKTIGQYLYQKSKVNRTLSTKEQPCKLTDPHSSQIYAKSKKIALQYIFELLDSDQDGLISNTKINITALPEELLRLLAPLLSEMEEVGVELSLQEFSTAFQRLYSTFSVDEKNFILKCYKPKQISSRISERPSFNPSLNQYSLRIARQICSEDVDIYESSIAKLKQKENRLNRMRAEKMLEEYSECTFHPRIQR